MALREQRHAGSIRAKEKNTQVNQKSGPRKKRRGKCQGRTEVVLSGEKEKGKKHLNHHPVDVSRVGKKRKEKGKKG